MILKLREKSLLVWQLEALERRTPPLHNLKDLVQFDLNKERKGIRGEKAIEFPLSFLSEEKFHILHNLRLADKNDFFQIDTLVLCERYILILEVKNWDGTFLFDDNDQVIRIDGDQEQGFQNPIPQVKLQQHRLQRWLRMHDINNLPIEYFIVFSFPSTIIKTASPNKFISQSITHKSQLFFKIQELDRKYLSTVIEMDKLIELSSKLKQAHTPPVYKLLERYRIQKEELLKGVFCPKCRQLPIDRKYGKWVCPNCSHISKHAHLEALNDFKLLISNEISNYEARGFLLLDSCNITKKLLQKEQFHSVGINKKRKYILEFR